MSFIFSKKLILIFFINICVNIYKINSKCDGCCCGDNKYTGDRGNGRNIKKRIINVKPKSITLDNECLNALENAKKPNYVVNEKYKGETDFYLVQKDVYDENYQPIIGDN